MLLTNHEIQNDEKKGENARVDGLAKYGSVSISIFSPNERKKATLEFRSWLPTGEEDGQLQRGSR